MEELTADPRRALVEPRFWTEAVCKRWLQHVGRVLLDDPAAAQPLAFVGVRLALRVVRRQRRREIRNRCILARAYGVLGSVYRGRGLAERAERALAKAAAVARSCSDPDIAADLNWRQALLALHQARCEDGSFRSAGLRQASELAEEAVRQARGAETGIQARVVRGVIRIRAGDAPGAVEDARAALAMIDARSQPYLHASALSVLVSALTRGGEEERRQAIAYLAEIRDTLPVRSPALRARLLWAEALLQMPRRKARARRLLDTARRTFLRLEMEAEAVAVTADLARLDPTGAVPQLCEEVLAILGGGPLRDLVQRLRAAALVERIDLAERLRSTVRAPGVLAVV